MSYVFDVRDDLDHQVVTAHERTDDQQARAAWCLQREECAGDVVRSRVDLCGASVLLVRAIAGEYGAVVSVQLQLLPSRAAWMIMCFHAVLGDRRDRVSLVSLRKSKLYF